MRIRLTIEVDVPTEANRAHEMDVKGKFDAQALKDIINLYGERGLVFLSSEKIGPMAPWQRRGRIMINRT